MAEKEAETDGDDARSRNDSAWRLSWIQMSPDAESRALRILVADGDQHARDGLKRLLRSVRRSWEVHCLPDASEALDYLKAAPCDVVLAAHRLAGLGGISFLQQVQERQPRAVRLLICGHADLQLLLRSLPVAHFILARPFESEQLIEAIERGASIQRLLENEHVMRTMSGIDSLPLRPEVYAQIGDLVRREDFALDQLVSIVEQDPSLCGRLLRVVNSGLFGLAERVASVRTAVSFAGTSLVESLALASGIEQGLRASRVPKGFSVNAEVDRSVRAAHAAAVLVDRRKRDEAFVAGLLHDIGRIVLACRLPELYVRSCEQAHRLRVPIVEAERDVIGSSHAELGAYLAGLWGLPFSVVEAIGFHHAPAAAGARDFGILGAVHVAAAMVPDLGALKTHALDREFIERLGLRSEVARWQAELLQEALP